MNRPSLITLREITRALSTTLDLDQTLDLIVRKTTELLQVDSCSLYLLEPDQVTLRLSATTGLSKNVLGYASLRVGEGMTGLAVARLEPVYAAVAHLHRDFKLVDHLSEQSFASLLAIPLAIQNRPIGAMNVQTRSPHDYLQEEIEMLLLIGDLAAGALAKAQLYQKKKTELDDLQALLQVSEAITSPQYLDNMLDIVTEMAARAMNVAICSLFLLDEEGTHLVLRSAQRRESEYQHRELILWGEGIVGGVAKNGRLEYVPNVSAEPRFTNSVLAQQEGVKSMLAVPLTVRDKVIGVLACYTTIERPFTDAEQTLFVTLANQTALAIENSRLVTNAAIIREMHHRIKNNLQTVAMLMQLQIPDADRLDTREVLLSNIHRIHSIATVHELLSERGFHLVDVKDVLVRIAHATAQAVNVPSRTIEIEVSGEPFSLPSQMATALALVVNELVQNAVEHAFIGRTHGLVQICLGKHSAEFLVWVRDDGVGLPTDMKHGLGLEIAQTLVCDDLRGELSFISLSRGTEVMIRCQIDDGQPEHA